MSFHFYGSWQPALRSVANSCCDKDRIERNRNNLRGTICLSDFIIYVSSLSLNLCHDSVPTDNTVQHTKWVYFFTTNGNNALCEKAQVTNKSELETLCETAYNDKHGKEKRKRI